MGFRLVRTVSVCVTVMWLGTAMPAAAQTVANASFESPNMGNSALSYSSPGGPNGFDLSPTGQGGAGFTFTGGVGIAAEGSDYFVDTPAGDQVGFLQNAGGTITQTVAGFTPGVAYTVNFIAAARPGTGGSSQPYGPNRFSITVDGTQRGTFEPLTSTFTPFSSLPFTAVSSSATLTFTGLGVAGQVDRTSFIDSVSITVVPEPSAMAVAVAATSAGLYRRRRPSDRVR